MAETTKLSVEKALNKLRGADAQKSKSDQVNEKIDALEEETRRMREQDCASNVISDVRQDANQIREMARRLGRLHQRLSDPLLTVLTLMLSFLLFVIGIGSVP